MNYSSGMCTGARADAKQNCRLASIQNGTMLQEQKKFQLALDAYLRSTRFVTFARQCLLRRGAQRLLVYILRQIAVAANHLFARLDANQPFRFAGIPGNFHSIGIHGFAPFPSPQYTRQFIAVGAYQAQSCAEPALSSLNPLRQSPCPDQSRCGP